MMPPGPPRDAWLDSKCGVETGLRAELAALIESDAAVRRRVQAGHRRFEAGDAHGLRDLHAKDSAGENAAAPAGSSGRVRKFVSRHELAVAAATLLALLLVTGALARWWEARAEQRRAANEQALIDGLHRDLPHPASAAPSSGSTGSDLSHRSFENLNPLSAALIRNPQPQIELGEQFIASGAAASASVPAHANRKAAQACFGKAIALLEPIASSRPDSLRARLGLARAKLELGRLSEDAPRGTRFIQDAAREFDEMSQRWPAAFEVHTQAAAAYEALGSAYAANRDYGNPKRLDAALEAQRKAVSHAMSAARLHPELSIVFVVLASDYSRLAEFTELGDRQAAIGLYREAIAQLDRVPPQDRNSPQVRSARYSALLGLGWNLGNVHALKPALAALEAARQNGAQPREENLVDSMTAYLRTIRTSPASDRGGSSDHDAATTTGAAVTASRGKVPGRLTGIQRWDWVDVLNVP